jgi:hypothetical protein
MRRSIRSLLRVGLIYWGALASASAQTTAEKTVVQQPQNSNYLAGLSGIQKWAVKLEASLRSQGNKTDKRKAKDELLPKVITIQNSLSDLEDINRRVMKDAGSQIEDLQRDKMGVDLNSLKEKIIEIESSFRDLREGVQAISLPEMTEVERLGEGLVFTKSFEIDQDLKWLGYADGRSDSASGIKINYPNLKASSDKIMSILHEAQDAFGKLHTYLEN